jgi:hypothetical protein
MAGARFYSCPAFFSALFVEAIDGVQGLLADAVTHTSVAECVAAGVRPYTTGYVPQSSVRFSANDMNNLVWQIALASSIWRAANVYRRRLHIAAGAATLPTFSAIARARSYPTRAITMIVPFAAGREERCILGLGPSRPEPDQLHVSCRRKSKLHPSLAVVRSPGGTAGKPRMVVARRSV